MKVESGVFFRGSFLEYSLQERDGSGATPLWLAAKGGESTGASEQQSFWPPEKGTQSDEVQKYGMN